LAAMVDEVNEEQQRYITCTAHDLNTPLTVFKLANSHLKEHFQEKKSEKCSSSSSNNNTAGRRGYEGNRADQSLREDDELLEIIDQVILIRQSILFDAVLSERS
jgi:signal transduction histidine kinase